MIVCSVDMHPTFAAEIYTKTQEVVENRVQTSLKGIEQRYGRQMSKLEQEKKEGVFMYNIHLYDKRKAVIQNKLRQESHEVHSQANRYLCTLGLATTPKAEKSSNSNTTLTQVGARVWTKTAAGARLQPLFTGREALRAREPDEQWNPFLGYIGPLSERAAVQSWVNSQPKSTTADTERGQCFKVDLSSSTPTSIKEALLYLKLREDGCSKAKSMVYSKRRRCMMDSTKRKDGPACHRTIRLGDNRAEGRNWKGWQLHPPKLLVGNRFQPMEPLTDLREYELLTREYERLQAKQEREKAGLDFEETDEKRSKYFRSLTREWTMRVKSKPQSGQEAAPVPQPIVSVVPPPVVTGMISSEVSVSLPSLPIFPMEERSTELPSIPPEMPTLPSTEETEAEVTVKVIDPPPSFVLDPSLVQTFPNGSLVFRAIPPVRQSFPELPTHQRQLKRNRTRVEFSDSSIHRHKTIKELAVPERSPFHRQTTKLLTHSGTRMIKEQPFAREVDSRG